MKGSVACMLEAVQCVSWNELESPIYFVATADEEVGSAGARKVVEHSSFYREIVDHGTKAIIGEPTRLEIVHAHKGCCLITAESKGVAGHSSTRYGKNANLAMIPFLAEMKKLHDETEEDENWHNKEFDPPTITMNIGINDHTRAINMTPGQSIATCFFRLMPGQDLNGIVDRLSPVAETQGLEFTVDEYGKPFYTDSK